MAHRPTCTTKEIKQYVRECWGEPFNPDTYDSEMLWDIADTLNFRQWLLAKRLKALWKVIKKSFRKMV